MCCIPEPNVTERRCGGFLAVSPRFAQVKIGVVADTEQAVREAFKISYGEWLNLVAPVINS